MKAILSSILALSISVTSHADIDALKNLKLPDVKIDSVTHVEGEHAHFDIDGVIGGTIKFEMLLPDEWNKRFAMGGGGGFVGTVQNGARSSVRQGYATVGTDTGQFV